MSRNRDDTLTKLCEIMTKLNANEQAMVVAYGDGFLACKQMYEKDTA